MMCADFLHLKETLDVFIQEKVDYLHIDIMDGHYVPNFGLGVDFCTALASYTKIPLDIHLMIENPDKFIPQFAGFSNAIVSFHPETSYHPMRTIQYIKSYNAKAGIILDPSIPLQHVQHLLPEVDILCIMTVNPGYSGQKLVPQSIEKIKEAAEYLSIKGYDIQIEVDGNVSWENLPRMLKAGGEVFVAGTSSIFGTRGDLTKNIRKFRSILDEFSHPSA